MRTNRRAQTGSTMVEFAMTLPLLAVLLFGIMQWGFIFSAYMTLRHGAHQTARVLSLPKADTSTANAKRIAGIAITPMLDPANLGTPVVDDHVKVVKDDDSVNVQLSYGLPLILKFVVPGGSSGVKTINAQATYRKNG